MNFPINIENWRLISGYDNYEISSHGRVRNNKSCIIKKPTLEDNGYLRTCLYKDGKNKSYLVHRLVAFAFLNRNEGVNEVDHIDHNRSNNIINNLRWTTKSVNQRNASRRTDNSSGTPGVHFNAHKNDWNARWQDENMKRKTKSFSVKKYGNAEAKQLAINYRKAMALENGYINV